QCNMCTQSEQTSISSANSFVCNFRQIAYKNARALCANELGRRGESQGGAKAPARCAPWRGGAHCRGAPMWADNPAMRVRFTKMQGAGNDFVVLDETQQALNLSEAQYRFLADRHFGIGADQILSVRPA